MFRLFHVGDESREVHDASRIGVPKFDLSFCDKGLGHFINVDGSRPSV